MTRQTLPTHLAKLRRAYLDAQDALAEADARLDARGDVPSVEELSRYVYAGEACLAAWDAYQTAKAEALRSDRGAA